MATKTLTQAVSRAAAGVMVPSAGFAGATAQPAQVGTGDYATRKPMAAVCAVPFQVFDSGTFDVPVAAWHINGIDWVGFSVDGGPLVLISVMTRSTQHAPVAGVAAVMTAAGHVLDGDWCDPYGKKFYIGKLAASLLSDGLHKVRVIVSPVAGVPRVLDDFEVSSNAGGTLPTPLYRYVAASGGSDSNDGLTPETPFATTNKAAHSMQAARGTNVDGCFIYLLGGDHTLTSAAFDTQSTTVSRWLTVTRAPGVARGDVRIVGLSGTASFNVSLTRFHDVTITTNLSTSTSTHRAWIDDVTLAGDAEARATLGVHQSYAKRYATNVIASELMTGLEGYDLVANATIDGLTGDAFSESRWVVNWLVTRHQQAGEAHADVWQWETGGSNGVLYGGDNTSGAGPVNGTFFTGSGVGLADMAVVDCRLFASYYTVQFGHAWQNVFVKDTDFVTGGTRLFEDTWDGTDVVFDGCTFPSGQTPSATGVVVR